MENITNVGFENAIILVLIVALSAVSCGLVFIFFFS
jgi:hypothetical protein